MIAEVWHALKAAPAHGPGLVKRRVCVESPVDIHAAMRKPKNVAILLVEAATESMPHGFAVPDAHGFSVTLWPVIPGPRGRVAIQLELLDAAGESVFFALVDDLLHRLAVAATERAALSEVSQAIKRWTAFFREQGVRGLSRERQQGLFGELLFLREHLARSADAALAVTAWVGPGGANQDFEYGGHAFEIKTTSKNPLSSVRINNLRQLDSHCVESLRLVVIELERHENANNTLPQAVNATRELILSDAPDQAFRFASLLIDYGFLDQQAALYEHTGYAVRAVRSFVVRDGFPLLIETDVPDGVGDVTYAIAMSAISEFELTPAGLQAEMEEWFSDLG